jgi:hypothetical protein
MYKIENNYSYYTHYNTLQNNTLQNNTLQNNTLQNNTLTK